jgi:hypothetical protein
MRPFLTFALALSLSLPAFGAMAQEAREQVQASTATVEPETIDRDRGRLVSYRVRIVGEWEEFAPSQNFVDFFDDGRVVLYLKKGEVGTLKHLEGTWSLLDDNRLRVEFAVNGQTIEQIATLSFDKDEMLLTGDNDSVSRHRRRNGPLPEDYRW